MLVQSPNYRQELFKIIYKSFNLDELKQLCFNLNIEFEDLSGFTRAVKVLELINYSIRHERLLELITTVIVQRPAKETELTNILNHFKDNPTEIPDPLIWELYYRYQISLVVILIIIAVSIVAVSTLKIISSIYNPPPQQIELILPEAAAPSPPLLEESKLYYMFIVDFSERMQERFDDGSSKFTAARDSTDSLLEILPQEAHYSLIALGSSSNSSEGEFVCRNSNKISAEWDTGQNNLEAQMISLLPEGKAMVSDAIGLAFNELNDEAIPEDAEKVLIMILGGGEECQTSNEWEVIESLKRNADKLKVRLRLELFILLDETEDASNTDSLIDNFEQLGIQKINRRIIHNLEDLNTAISDLQLTPQATQPPNIVTASALLNISSTLTQEAEVVPLPSKTTQPEVTSTISASQTPAQTSISPATVIETNTPISAASNPNLPTATPGLIPSTPTIKPTIIPTQTPSHTPTITPSAIPTNTRTPTSTPTKMPTPTPTKTPVQPTQNPIPTQTPTSTATSISIPVEELVVSNNIVYARTSSNLQRSDNCGGSWVSLTVSLPTEPGNFFAIETDESKIHIGARYGIFVSNDSGNTFSWVNEWRYSDPIQDIDFQNGYGWAVMENWGYDSGPYRQTPGNIWELRDNSLPSLDLQWIVADPIDPLNIAYVGSEYSTYKRYRTLDSGLTWEEITGLESENSILFSYNDNGTPIVLAQTQYSVDRGETWLSSGISANAFFRDDSNGKLYAASSLGGIYVGTPGGTWSDLGLSSAIIKSFVVCNNKILAASTSNQLYILDLP